MAEQKPIISIDHVSMRFNLAKEKHESLKEYFVALLHGGVRFDEFFALSDVSFDIMPGDFYGLIGLNGSGKSTLLKVISGVYKPSAGKVTVNGTIAPLIELGAGFDMDLTARENIYLNGTVLGYTPKYIDSKFDDIVEFCKNHGGLISIHAGKKSNGIDKEISNALPVKEAIKSDIAKHVDFFEVGKKKDIVDYYKYVFKEIDEKPIILCSDCHDPRKYSAKESLWIKANVTFEGLKQCIFQPSERVYVGTIPAAVDRVNKNKKANIDSLSVHRIIEPKNDGVSWFDFDISLNAGLVAVIGNKGSGKSAFSDIIGQVCKCRTMGSASFLNDNRFRKMPKNLASDYIAEIKWKDGHLE